ncbi:hypothetical protein BDY19DRAFT_879925 [Irpex rosettiformis]|uniref:Uncharacterized protein n=1 Tax=Irpex rosettiformis TaxID=378272 RepID=A0ACB8UJM6_9APHY|nr:hypothetical protein BDY19DRAFT_879925 [Irpex rosettiformis]
MTTSTGSCYSLSADLAKVSASCSSFTNWKCKYNEVADMLQETRQELDDFQVSSRELEEELERELARTEQAQQDLKVKAARAEHERDEWKSKFMTLQTMHNTTSTSLQRELDTLRRDYQEIKVQLRELEMGNDDLERNERAISSSLADVEQKYSRVLEEKILLEHELLDKAHLEEECQRLKDELRDANEEITIVKEHLSAALDRAPVEIPPSAAPSRASQASDSEEEFAHTPIHRDPFEFSSASSPALKRLSPIITSTSRSAGTGALSGQAAVLQRAGFHPRTPHTTSSTSIPPPLTRSTTVPLSTSNRTPSQRNFIAKPLVNRNNSNISSSSTGTVATSKGVQMLSEMRARVEVLGQKIHTRVPRIRMGTGSNRTASGALVAAPPPPPPPKAGPSSVRSPSTSSTSTKSSFRSRSPEKTMTVKSRRPSVDLDDKTTPIGNTSGWVLVMEDSPSPTPVRDKEQRRKSGTAAPSAFRPLSISSTHTFSTQSPTDSRPPSSLANSNIPTGIRRPQSRTSEGRSSISTNATTSTASSIATPTSRPTTPTFLPMPTAGLYFGTGQKRSTGPTSVAFAQPKRSTTTTSLPVRQSNKLGSPSYAQSRIGRPTPPNSPGKMRSNNVDFADAQHKHSRVRAGNAALLLGSLRLQQDQPL